MKRILIILCVLMFAFAISACAGDNMPIEAAMTPELTTMPTNAPAPDPDDTSEPIEVTEGVILILENGEQCFFIIDDND